jgi:hypothetical protein
MVKERDCRNHPAFVTNYFTAVASVVIELLVEADRSDSLRY